MSVSLSGGSRLIFWSMLLGQQTDRSHSPSQSWTLSRASRLSLCQERPGAASSCTSTRWLLRPVSLFHCVEKKLSCDVCSESFETFFFFSESWGEAVVAPGTRGPARLPAQCQRVWGRLLNAEGRIKGQDSLDVDIQQLVKLKKQIVNASLFPVIWHQRESWIRSSILWVLL